jgi:hypothetical protein
LIINITDIELYDFAYPHTIPHELQHQTIPYFGVTENDFLDGFLLMDLPMPQFLRPKNLFFMGVSQGFESLLRMKLKKALK